MDGQRRGSGPVSHAINMDGYAHIEGYRESKYGIRKVGLEGIGGGREGWKGASRVPSSTSCAGSEFKKERYRAWV